MRRGTWPRRAMGRLQRRPHLRLARNRRAGLAQSRTFSSIYFEAEFKISRITCSSRRYVTSWGPHVAVATKEQLSWLGVCLPSVACVAFAFRHGSLPSKTLTCSAGLAPDGLLPGKISSVKEWNAFQTVDESVVQPCHFLEAASALRHQSERPTPTSGFV